MGLSASFYDKRNKFDLLKGQNHKTAKLKGEETSGESIPVILSFLSIFDLFPPLTLVKKLGCLQAFIIYTLWLNVKIKFLSDRTLLTYEYSAVN